MELRGPRLRVAIAGAGFAAGMHLAAWARIPSAEVVAICDPDSAKAQARAREFGVANTFTDAAAMVDEIRPDALDIAAPVEAHVALCLLAAERGVDVLCQKPLAPSLDEANALADAVEGRVRLMVNENWRFRPWYRRLRRWLDEGAVGEPVSFVVHVRGSGLIADAKGDHPQLARQPSYARIERLMIGDVLVHHLDVARWLVGPLRVVRAALGRRCEAVRGEDCAAILLEGDARWALVDGNFAVPGAPPVPVDRLEIVGTQGVATFADDVARLSGRREETARFDLAAGYADSYAGAIAHFASSLASGAPFETGVRDNLETLALVERAYAVADRLFP